MQFIFTGSVRIHHSFRLHPTTFSSTLSNPALIRTPPAPFISGKSSLILLEMTIFPKITGILPFIFKFISTIMLNIVKNAWRQFQAFLLIKLPVNLSGDYRLNSKVSANFALQTTRQNNYQPQGTFTLIFSPKVLLCSLRFFRLSALIGALSFIMISSSLTGFT